MVFHFVSFLLVGLAAGWLAGYLTRGSGFGLVGSLIVGVAGSLLGGFLFRLIPEFVKELALATVGAMLFLTVVGLIVPRLRRKRAKKKGSGKAKKKR